MRVLVRWSAGIGAVLVVFAATADREPALRQLTVRQGPDSVFVERDVSTIVPELAGATATGTNGRVGNELVFWSYDLADGRPVFFFACVVLRGVDCERRSHDICDNVPNVLTMSTADGKVRHITCQPVASAQSAAQRPGCQTLENLEPLSVGVVQCR